LALYCECVRETLTQREYFAYIFLLIDWKLDSRHERSRNGSESDGGWTVPGFEKKNLLTEFHNLYLEHLG